MWIGFLFFGFFFLIMTFNIMMGNFSPDEVESYWITLVSTFVVTACTVVAAARFGRYSSQVNSKVVGSASALGASMAPVITPFLLNGFEITHHTLLIYGGGWMVGLFAALALALPIAERIERNKRAPIYWTPPADGL
jgi:hypothetical protein